jgi:ketosteroid isomerase-like protein
MSNTNLPVFEAQMAAFAAMDTERLMTSFDRDAVLQDMSTPDTPWTGSEQIREFLHDYFSHLSKVEVTIASVAASDDRVFAELEVHAAYAADAASPSHFRDVLMRYCVVETFSQGKIVHERFYWDRAELESQLSDD